MPPRGCACQGIADLRSGRRAPNDIEKEEFQGDYSQMKCLVHRDRDRPPKIYPKVKSALPGCTCWFQPYESRQYPGTIQSRRIPGETPCTRHVDRVRAELDELERMSR